MISLETARKLKIAGLTWKPKLHDFFAIPDRDMDDVTFVISDVQVTLDVLFGRQVVSFQGASEWALDSLVRDEAVWLPREDQLREALEATLSNERYPSIHLKSGVEDSRVSFEVDGQRRVFQSADASEAYAEGLAYMLQQHTL
jgi:hypothetical protein